MITPATVAERNSIAYQGGTLLLLRRKALKLKSSGVTYRQLRVMFGVSTTTLCKWIRIERTKISTEKPKLCQKLNYTPKHLNSLQH